MNSASPLLRIAAPVAACLAMLTIHPSAAQTPDQGSFDSQMSNQLGILDYCVAKGFPSQATAKTYEGFVASLPEPDDPQLSALFRQKGKEGIIYNGEDSQIPVEQMVEGTGQTLADYCKSFDENAKAFAPPQ